MYQSAEAINQLDVTAYTRYSENLDRIYRDKVFKYQKDMDSITNQLAIIDAAWRRVDEMGVVDNQAAVILGVEPGTPSRAAREAVDELNARLKLQQDQYNKDYSLMKARYKEEQALIDQKAEYDAANNPDLIIANATPEQLANYNNIMKGYLSPTNNTTKGDPTKALDAFSTRYKIVEELIGPELTKVMKNELYSMATTQPEATKPREYTSEEKISQTIQDMRVAGYTTTQMIDELNSDPIYETEFGSYELRRLIEQLGGKYNPTTK